MFRVKYSREIILKILYQIDVLKANAGESEEILRNHLKFFRGPTSEEKEFISGIVRQVLKDKPRIDHLISANLIAWKIERLNPIDRNLLRMGIAESGISEKAKKVVIIDDILRIAKKYSEHDAYKIINAILDKVIP